MASLGQELRRERELRGISLREIADSTRISLRFLQAIEEDHLDRVPGAFFIRAILRSYAKCIGIDEHQVLNKYQEMLSFQEQRHDKEAGDKTPPQQLPRVFSRKRIGFVAAAIVFIAVGLALLYIFSRSPQEKPSALQETELPASLPAVIPEPPLPAEAAIEEIRGLLLRFDFFEETWLHVYVDGESIWDGLKAAGESLEVTAEREVRFYVGNAGGFGLTINGQKAESLGPRGAVRQDIRITPENYSDFLVPGNPNES
jgi:transcriptional regulator with XRE-family HTH domain